MDRCLARAAVDLLYLRRVYQGSVLIGFSNRRVLRVAAVSALALALGLTLSACGRKGALDLPPGAQLIEAPEPQQFDSQGRALAPPGQKKRLPIDILLD